MGIKLQISESLVEDQSILAHDFISTGIACFAFALLDEYGFIDKLLAKDVISTSDFSNSIVLKTALKTLVNHNIISVDQDVCQFTSFGETLALHRGSIGLIYNGYSKVLSNQNNLLIRPSFSRDLINDNAVSTAAAHMGKYFVNDRILEILKKNKTMGAICDLGCGNATTLQFLCRNLGVAGLGIDISASSIEAAQKSLLPTDCIALEVNNILEVQETHPEVEVVLQAFVFHDFSDELCEQTLQALRKNFPNLKLFICVDAVSPEEHESQQLPGFDYVHSLLGIQPRTCSEAIQVFAKAGFSVQEQQSIDGLTNCYIWTLNP